MRVPRQKMGEEECDTCQVQNVYESNLKYFIRGLHVILDGLGWCFGLDLRWLSFSASWRIHWNNFKVIVGRVVGTEQLCLSFGFNAPAKEIWRCYASRLSPNVLFNASLKTSSHSSHDLIFITSIEWIFDYKYVVSYPANHHFNPFNCCIYRLPERKKWLTLLSTFPVDFKFWLIPLSISIQSFVIYVSLILNLIWDLIALDVLGFIRFFNFLSIFQIFNII